MAARLGFEVKFDSSGTVAGKHDEMNRLLQMYSAGTRLVQRQSAKSRASSESVGCDIPSRSTTDDFKARLFEGPAHLHKSATYHVDIKFGQ